jgi:hypothetical protein
MDQVSRLFDLFSLKAVLAFTLLVFAAPALFIGIAKNFDWKATFSVDASTEIVEFTTGQQNIPNWYVTIDRLRADGSDVELPEAQLAIGRDTRVRAIRLQTGALRLDIASQGNGPAAELYDAADNRILRAEQRLQALIALPANAALTLPLAGRATIGDTVFSQTIETSPVLLDGTVKVYGLSFFGRNRFAAGEASLDTGDRVEIDYEKATGGGHGMLRVDPERAGIQTVFHADGVKARVIRFGTGGYELRPSMWARISSDPLYQAMLAIYAAILPVVGIGMASTLAQWRLRRLSRRQQSDSETSDESTSAKVGDPVADNDEEPANAPA